MHFNTIDALLITHQLREVAAYLARGHRAEAMRLAHAARVMAIVERLEAEIDRAGDELQRQIAACKGGK